MSRVETNWAALQKLAVEDPAVAAAIENMTPEDALRVTEYAEGLGLPSWLDGYTAGQQVHADTAVAEVPAPRRKR